MPYEAKTNWKYDDTVTEKDLNRIEQGLKDAHVAEYKDITLKPGVQIVDVPEDTPFRMGEIRGRTLINLLGRAGGCTDHTLWNLWQSSITTHSSFVGLQVKSHPEKKYGNAHNYIDNVNLGQAYVVVGNIENGTTGGRVRLETQELDGEKVITSHYSNEVTSVSNRQPMHLAFAISDSRTKRFSVNLAVVADATEVTGYFDSIRVYQIPKADVEKINAMNPEEVSAYYSYVDSMTNVTNPYAIGTSVNLLPPTYKFWNNDSTIISDYSFEFSAKENENKGIFYDVAVIPNRSYAVSSICSNVRGKIRLEYYKDLSSAGNIKNFLKPKTYHSAEGHSFFTTPPSCGCVRVYLTNEQADNVFDAGEYRFSDFAMYPGDKPQPFASQSCSGWAAECKLAANPVDGSNADVLYMNEDGLPYVLEKWGKLPLIEGQKWVLVATYTGFKQVGESNNVYPITGNQGLVVKNDGKLLPNFTGIPASPDMGTISQNSGQLHITVSNKDSGWGDNYKPEPDEIKAYFLGWKMYDTETSKTAEPYNRTDGKYKGWVRRNDAGQFVDGTGTLPTTQAPLNSCWTPYRLQYLKAKPTVEAVTNYETGLTLSKGWNMVDVSSGIVIREKATPKGDDTNMYLHSRGHGNRLKYLVGGINGIYRNGCIDTTWAHYDSSMSIDYGVKNAQCPLNSYDPKAVYHVTYTILDPTLATPISGTIAANLRGIVTDMVSWASDAEQRLSVVEIQKENHELADSTSKLQNKYVGHGDEYKIPIDDLVRVDLNSGFFKREGEFSYTKPGTPNNVVNIPVGARSPFILRVRMLADATGLLQEYIEIPPNGNLTTCRRWYREIYAGAWQPWKPVITTDSDGALRIEKWLDVRGDGPVVNSYGQTHVFSQFFVNNQRKGYIGVGDPNAPNNINIASDHADLHLYAAGVISLQGRNVLYEIDQLKQSGNDAKRKWVDAVVANGVSASTADSADTLAAKTRQGRMGSEVWVSGEAMRSNGQGNRQYATVELATIPAGFNTVFFFTNLVQNDRRGGTFVESIANLPENPDSHAQIFLQDVHGSRAVMYFVKFDSLTYIEDSLTSFQYTRNLGMKDCISIVNTMSSNYPIGTVKSQRGNTAIIDNTQPVKLYMELYTNNAPQKFRVQGTVTIT